jgi:hypothetical protein
MGELRGAHEPQTRVGRLAARALLKVLDGLRAAEVRVDRGEVELLGAEAPLIEGPVDVGEPCELSEEELLVLAELAEEQDDPFIPPPRPCRALRRNRAWRASSRRPMAVGARMSVPPPTIGRGAEG